MNNSDFRVVMADAMADEQKTVTDERTIVQRMFYDFDQATGTMKPLPILKVAPGEDYKLFNSCIPFIENFRGDEKDFNGNIKGKDVIVIGGRHRGKAGTGVEFILPVDEALDFCEYIKRVVESVRK